MGREFFLSCWPPLKELFNENDGSKTYVSLTVRDFAAMKSSSAGSYVQALTGFADTVAKAEGVVNELATVLDGTPSPAALMAAQRGKNRLRLAIRTKLVVRIAVRWAWCVCAPRHASAQSVAAGAYDSGQGRDPIRFYLERRTCRWLRGIGEPWWNLQLTLGAVSGRSLMLWVRCATARKATRRSFRPWSTRLSRWASSTSR